MYPVLAVGGIGHLDECSAVSVRSDRLLAIMVP